jgi:hypothetical protein
LFPSRALHLKNTIREQYNKYCIYFVAELIKFCVAAGWTGWKYSNDLDGRKFMKVSQRDLMQ